MLWIVPRENGSAEEGQEGWLCPGRASPALAVPGMHMGFTNPALPCSELPHIRDGHSEEGMDRVRR